MPGAAAIACLQISIILMDDMLDADPRGEYHALGMLAVANLAAALLAEAQNILIRCGAVSYCMDQILGRYRKAQRILATTSVYRKEGLQALLDGVIEPVKKLFEFAAPQPTADPRNAKASLNSYP